MNVRDLPEWQQAHRDYIDDLRPDEVDEDDVYIRRINAAFRLRSIEQAHKARPDIPAT